jgi:hypothetical protein
MSVNVTYSLSVAGSGASIQSQVVRTGNASIGLVDTLDAAKTGQLTTRTDNTTGTLTMAASHGITTAAVIDLYWTGGVRYGVVVGTVSVNSVPISGGAGDNLPSNLTNITAQVQQTANIYIDGDNTELIAIELRTNDRSLRTAGHIGFFDAANDLIAELDLVTNVPQVYDIAAGVSNPFTGDPITYAKISQGGTSTTETYQLQIIGVYDATP